MHQAIFIDTKKHEGKHYFQVRLLVRPVMEDMFETFVHVGLFESIHDAERLVEKLKQAQRDAGFHCITTKLNLDYWTWPVSRASCFGYMAEPSKAKFFVYKESQYAKDMAEYINRLD